MGRLTALPATLIMGGLLVGAAALLNRAGVSPGHAVQLGGNPVIWLVKFAILAAPLLAAIAGVIGLVELALHRRDRAIDAGIAMAVIVAIDIAWNVTPLGGWALAHLASL